MVQGPPLGPGSSTPEPSPWIAPAFNKLESGWKKYRLSHYALLIKAQNFPLILLAFVTSQLLF